MRQVVYALRFTGQATPASSDGNLLTVSATAPGATLTTSVDASGLVGALEPAEGGEATFASEVTITGGTSFQAIGTLVVGDGNVLRVATVGNGYLGPGPDSAARYGSVAWRVEHGDGQFAGACGLITSNLVIDADLRLIDHHLGVLFLTEGVAALL